MKVDNELYKVISGNAFKVYGSDIEGHNGKGLWVGKWNNFRAHNIYYHNSSLDTNYGGATSKNNKRKKLNKLNNTNTLSKINKTSFLYDILTIIAIGICCIYVFPMAVAALGVV
tara:strand:+ start:532 stop:873 length:342 start_codon:yes stop_codon:yes gene_type:complete